MGQKRVVINIKGNLTFCGIHKGIKEIDGRNGVLIETDPSISLAIWCPEENVESIVEVPIKASDVEQ